GRGGRCFCTSSSRPCRATFFRDYLYSPTVSRTRCISARLGSPGFRLSKISSAPERSCGRPLRLSFWWPGRFFRFSYSRRIGKQVHTPWRLFRYGSDNSYGGLLLGLRGVSACDDRCFGGPRLADPAQGVTRCEITWN